MKISAYLTKEKLLKAIEEEGYSKTQEALASIQLHLEDGPLLQIKHITDAKEA